MDLDTLSGLMVATSKECSKKVSCMVMGTMCGRMVEDMKAITDLIRSMVKEHTHTLMVASIEGNGKMELSTAMAAL